MKFLLKIYANRILITRIDRRCSFTNWMGCIRDPHGQRMGSYG